MPARRKKKIKCEPCQKHLYRSYAQAVGTALGASRRRGVALRIYQCPWQPGYHLTKQQKRG